MKSREDTDMDIPMIKRNLRQAVEHVELGESHISRQRQILLELSEHRAGTVGVEQLLTALESSMAGQCLMLTLPR
jgi:hypothetical protein